MGPQYILDPKTGKLIPNPDYTPPITGTSTGVHNVNGRSVLMNEVTGEIIRDLGPAVEQQKPLTFEEQIRLRQVPTTSSSTSTSTSYNTSQSLADPRQLEIQQKQLELATQTAKQEHDLAVEAQDFTKAKYWQDRLDSLNMQKADLAFKYAGLGQSGDIARQQLDESRLTREQQAQLHAIDSALAASQFAKTYGLSVAQQQEQARQNRVGNAETFARLISGTDTAALPAFYKAGGGVISNALHSGADALSENALRPAADVLGLINMSNSGYAAPQPQQPSPLSQQQIAAQAMADAYNRAHAAPNTVADGPRVLADQARAQSMADAINAGTAPNPSEANARMDAAGVPSWVNRFAFGTGPATGAFITGDSTNPTNPAAGGAHPEMVSLHDPEGNATASVTPLTPPGTGDSDGSVGSLFTAIGNFLSANEGGDPASPAMGMGGMPSGMPSRFAFGTDPSGIPIAPSDLPFLDQVRQLRQSVDTTPPITGGYFNVGYQNIAPSLRGAYEQSLQTRFGIPVADVRAEANRFAIPGTGRDVFTSGYGGGAKQDL